jgi:hypothetical protein
MPIHIDRSFLWLIIGACVGAAAVFVATDIAGLSLPGWVGALVPTLSAIVFVGVGPKSGQTQPVTDSDFPHFPAAGV